MKVWIVTYGDDNFADEFGSKVFRTEAEAKAWYEDWIRDCDPASQDPQRFANYEEFDLDELPQ